MGVLRDLFAVLFGIFMVFAATAGIILVFGLLWSIPTMLLWDWLMPDLFGLQEITIWQAWGINILSGILFKAKNTKSDKKSKVIKKKEVILG